MRSLGYIVSGLGAQSLKNQPVFPSVREAFRFSVDQVRSCHEKRDTAPFPLYRWLRKEAGLFKVDISRDDLEKVKPQDYLPLLLKSGEPDLVRLAASDSRNSLETTMDLWKIQKLVNLFYMKRDVDAQGARVFAKENQLLPFGRDLSIAQGFWINPNNPNRLERGDRIRIHGDWDVSFQDGVSATICSVHQDTGTLAVKRAIKGEIVPGAIPLDALGCVVEKTGSPNLLPPEQEQALLERLVHRSLQGEPGLLPRHSDQGG